MGIELKKMSREMQPYIKDSRIRLIKANTVRTHCIIRIFLVV